MALEGTLGQRHDVILRIVLRYNFPIGSNCKFQYEFSLRVVEKVRTRLRVDPLVREVHRIIAGVIEIAYTR